MTIAALIAALGGWLVPGALATPPAAPGPADLAGPAGTGQGNGGGGGKGGTGGVAASAVPAKPLPADSRPEPAAPCARTPRAPGWIEAENRRPGTRAWRDAIAVNDDRATMGYLDRTTASCGDNLALHLSGPGPWTQVTAIRMGWYRGAGGRVVWTSGRIPTTRRPLPRPKAPTNLVEASWPSSARIPVTADWVPGVYLLMLTSAQGERSLVPLVVRDANRSAPLLFMASTLTWQAYNKFGGRSLYYGPGHDPAVRSRVVSFDRPYNHNGLRSMLVYDLTLVRYLEQLGHDVDYTDDLDLDQRPSQLLHHRALVVPGHSEYWTTRMYDAVERARDAGVNIAFFGANQVYWHARMEASPAGQNRRLAVYRYLKEDKAGQRDPALATVRWGSPPLNRPQLGLTGANFGKFGTVAHLRVVDAGSWVFAGTGLRDGEVLRRSVAGEWDRVEPHPLTPPAIQVLAEAPILKPGGQPTMATMSYYTSPSRAGVFNAGATYWPCHLYGTCPGMRTPAQTREAVRTITANVLRAFAAGPAGVRHPAVPRPPTDPGDLVRSSRPADVAMMPRPRGEE